MLNPALEIETINYARKTDFMEIAGKLGLPVKAYMRKAAICDMIIHHYISTNVLGEEAKDYLSSEISSVGLTVEQKLEFERLAVEREKAQLALQQEQEKARIAQIAAQQAQLAASAGTGKSSIRCSISDSTSSVSCSAGTGKSSVRCSISDSTSSVSCSAGEGKV